MFSIALVVFREAFEIVLIIGIILAATRTMPNRARAIGAGFAGGIAGSALVALFTDRISQLAEGVGQEIFNAGILLTAALFIGWTVLWMKRHGREMKGQFTDISRAVSEGRLTYLSLSLVIMLALLREGSEIVLFTYGMIASGQTMASIVLGFAAGAAGGISIGLLIYKGLLKISMRYFFAVTSWLLVFLVAGMISQAIGFLVAAGVIESLSRTIWDSSWLISDQSLLGQSLKALLGYTSRPMEIQLVIYAATLLGLGFLMRLVSNQNSELQKMNRMAAAIAVAMMTSLMLASPAYAFKKVYSPYVEKGELEVEWKGSHVVDNEDDEDGEQEQELSIGYGVNDFWNTEIAGEIEKSGVDGEDYEFTAVEWENKFQLTQPGEYWADVGAQFAYVHNVSGDADAIEGKLLLAKDVGKFSTMLNLNLEKSIGAESEGDWPEGGLAISSRYRWKPWLEPGVEWFSEFGELGNSGSFDNQGHSIGPALYGKIGPVKYDVGYQFGVSDGAPDGEAKAILEYEFRF